MPKMSESSGRIGLLEIFLIYLRLGCLSFGGPVAHMGYFKDEFVNRRKWLNDADYAELLGICQFVPGPSSSQLGFAIGWHRSGLSGAGAAWLGFTLPSALLMISFGYGLFAWEQSIGTLVQGLLIAAVAVVANATLGLGRKLCPDLPRLAIAVLASILVLTFPGSLTQIAVIVMGGLIGQKLAGAAGEERPQTQPSAERDRQLHEPHSLKHRARSLRTIGLAAVGVYGVILALSLWIDLAHPGAIYALHYRAGALVFGGGHVVLPLLNDSIVAGGLVTEESFLAGYSAAQALPGPLFTLSAFLGTVGGQTSPAWLGGLLALVAIFLPGMLLLLGLLPFWSTVRQKQWAQSALTGANAAVVGLLLAALIDPVWTHGIRTIGDFGVGCLAFLALYRCKLPAWLVVLGCGATTCFFY